MLQVALALAVAGFYLTGAWHGTVLDSDGAYYVGLAQSLATGAGFEFNGVAHTQYPPGFPIVLVPAVVSEVLDVSRVTLYVSCWGVLSLLAVWGFIRQRGAPDVIALLFAGSATVFAEFTTVRSEAVFVAFLFFLLMAVERDGESAHPWWMAAAICALSALLSSIRSIGVATLVAAPMALLWTFVRGQKPHRRQVIGLGAAFLGAAAFQAAWFGRLAKIGSHGSYLSLFLLQDPHEPDLGAASPSSIALRILENATTQLTRAVELLTNLGGWTPFALGAAQLAVLFLVGLGVRRELQRENPFAAWFFLAYLAVIVMWPFDEGPRFLMPVLPLLLMFGHEGLSQVMTRIKSDGDRLPWKSLFWILCLLAAGAGIEVVLRGTSRQGLLHVTIWLTAAILARAGPRVSTWLGQLDARILSGLYAGVFLALAAPRLLSTHEARRTGAPLGSARIAGAIAWVEQNTQPDARLMATLGEAGLYLHTGRPTTLLPVTGRPEVLWDAVDQARPEFIVVPTPSPYPYYRPTGPERIDALRTLRRDRLRLVYTYDLGQVYEVSDP